MAQISQSVGRLIDELAKLPGIGRKSAERLAYHLLRVHQSEALGLADAIRDVRQNVRYCSVCFNLAEGERFARDRQRASELSSCLACSSRRRIRLDLSSGGACPPCRATVAWTRDIRRRVRRR